MKKISRTQSQQRERATTKRVLAAVAVTALLGGLVANETRAAAGRTESASERGADHTAYDPEKSYPGVHESGRLYKIVLGSDAWAGSRRPARLDQLTCRDARAALEHNGFWRGPLNVNGTCGAGEPTEWAIGNFLNFQAGRHGEDSEL